MFIVDLKRGTLFVARKGLADNLGLTISKSESYVCTTRQVMVKLSRSSELGLREKATFIMAWVRNGSRYFLLQRAWSGRDAFVLQDGVFDCLA
jgi:hypothetical protein